MPRWTCCVIKLDKIRNEYISLGVTNIAQKIRETRLIWFKRVE